MWKDEKVVYCNKAKIGKQAEMRCGQFGPFLFTTAIDS